MSAVTQLRYQALLKRLFAIKADDPGRVLNPIIAPSYDVRDADAPEERALRGEKLWGFSQVIQNPFPNFAAERIGIDPNNSLKVGVIKRVTFVFDIPTAAVQPGIMYFGVSAPFTGFTATGQGFLSKDGRLNPGVNVGAVRRSGIADTATSLSSFISTALFFGKVVPGTAPATAAGSFTYVWDHANIVLVPNTYVQLNVKADTAGTANYNWHYVIEGYERTVDPSELIAPP